MSEKSKYDAIVVVEIPQGSLFKYEFDKESNMLMVDRPLNQPCPYNYGYIPKTLCGDGDPLDVFILGDTSIQPLAGVKVFILGALRCTDNGDSDDKLIAIIAGDENWMNGSGSQLISNYLTSYKSGFVIEERLARDAALELYKKAQETYAGKV